MGINGMNDDFDLNPLFGHERSGSLGHGARNLFIGNVGRFSDRNRMFLNTISHS